MSFLSRRLLRLRGRAAAEPTQDSESNRLVSLLSAHGITHILDAGANIGQYATRLRRAGYVGRITSFEPGSAAHSQLSAAAAADPLWNVAPRLALGAQPGAGTLHVSNRTDMNSLLPVADATLKALPKSFETGQETVEIARLDALFDRFVGPDEKVFLKLDTQGSEMSILDGARGIVDRLTGMQLELSLLPLYEGETTYLELLRRLEADGFEAYWFLPGYFSKRIGRQLQMDGILFRRTTARS